MVGVPPVSEREPDDTVEIPAVAEAVADAIADGDDGPPCGSPEAITSLWVSYTLKGLTHIDRGRYCCTRHIPAEAQHMPAGAEPIDVVIQDGLVQTTVRADGSTTVLLNLDYMIGQTATFPQDWPYSRNAAELGDFDLTIP
jgi:hypothetical protein